MLGKNGMSVKKLINSICAPVFVTAICWAGKAAADLKLNMPEGVTETSRMVFDLHMKALWMVTIIGLAVFAVMIYSLVAHRKSRGVEPAKFHHSTRLEIIWTVIPIIILVVFAFPATKTLITMEETADADLTIKVTGYQWKWRYDYLDEDFGFFSSLATASNEARQLKSGVDVGTVDNYLLEVDNPVVIPVNKKIRLITTANDVIHSWWVPDLGWKRDAIPGFINDNWTMISEPGIYRGQCAELCGKDHGFMPVVVKAVPEQEYVQWVEQMKVSQAEAAAGIDREWTREELMERGQQVYNTNCVACHQADGKGIPPAFPPLTGSAIATGPLEGHIDVVLHGRTGTTMQAFGEQLNAADLAAVITFERNSLGNNVGDMVQPSEIQSALQ